MSSEWPIVQLGDLVDIKHGWPFKSEFFSTDEDNSTLPIVVGIGNFEYSGGFRFDSTQIKRYCGEFPQEYVLQPEEILLVMTCQTSGGEILGIPGRVPNDGYTYLHNQRLGKVIIKSSRVLGSFLYWIFLHPDFRKHLVNSASGTKILHTAPSRIESFKFRLPPIEEQKHIADVLNSLGDRITLLSETNTTLEVIVQALFKSWFIDFDPVHAKAEGRAPEGMDAVTAALFPNELEESELGLVPRGWQAGTVSDIVTESTKRVGSTKASVLSAVQTGNLVKSEEHFTKRVHSEDISKYKAVAPLSFAYNPSRINIGSIGLNEFGELGGVSPIYIVVEPSSATLSYFIWHHLRTSRFKETIKMMASGTVRQSLSYRDFSNIKLVLPSSPVLEAFNKIRTCLYVGHTSNLRQIENLEKLRDLILPRLISGELQISETKVETETDVLAA